MSVATTFLNSKFESQFPIKVLAFFVVAMLGCDILHASNLCDIEPDTIVVEFDDSPIDFSTGARQIGYRSVTSFTFSDLNADSIPLMRTMPKWIRSFVNSWTQGDVDHTRAKRFDVSFAVSPSYTREASFGIGGAITGLYRINRNDTLDQPSMMFASINASLNGFYVLKNRGNIYLPDNRWRIDYNIELSRRALDFWGATAAETNRNEKSSYDRRQIDVRLDFSRRMSRDFFLGPVVQLNNTEVHKMSRPEYLSGEPRKVFACGVGIIASIDTRDAVSTPTKGVLLQYRPVFFPQATVSTHKTFMSNRLQFNVYKEVWHNCVLATDIYAKFNSRHTPWTMKEMVASDGIRMRGYYMGRYIDNNQIALQLELRQHIWDRLGVNLWAGMASIFPKFGKLNSNDEKRLWLPNAGIGLRFQFKYRVNARVDCGFGRHTMGILFAVGEAF